MDFAVAFPTYRSTPAQENWCPKLAAEWPREQALVLRPAVCSVNECALVRAINRFPVWPDDAGVAAQRLNIGGSLQWQNQCWPPFGSARVRPKSANTRCRTSRKTVH